MSCLHFDRMVGQKWVGPTAHYPIVLILASINNQTRALE